MLARDKTASAFSPFTATVSARKKNEIHFFHFSPSVVAVYDHYYYYYIDLHAERRDISPLNYFRFPQISQQHHQQQQVTHFNAIHDGNPLAHYIPHCVNSAKKVHKRAK